MSKMYLVLLKKFIFSGQFCFEICFRKYL